MLVRTKLQRPRWREDLVERPRLLQELNACIGDVASPQSGSFSRKLILISAPAGYGKTTIISQWLEKCASNTAWVSLDAGNSDLGVFLAHLTSAVQTFSPGACSSTVSLLQTHPLPPISLLAHTFTNELSDLPGNLVVVLDDFHLITGSAVPQFLTQLLDHLPDKVCLALAGRHDPDLPLNRLRANGEMTELRMLDLSFTIDETQFFLEKAVGHDISSTDLETLNLHTEGWIAGLRLVAMSLKGTSDPAAFVQTLKSTGHRYVIEYLINEVLAQQTSDIQSFLLHTSMLDRFCAPLCDSILDIDHSDNILEKIDQRNLFLIPLDIENKWFRYHHLFQDLLVQKAQSTFSEAEIFTLHAQASTWFENKEYVEEAMSHALAAGDMEGAARMVEERYRQMINNSQWARLRRWLGRLPEDLINRRAGLLLATCWCLHREFRIPDTIPVLEKAVLILNDPELNAYLDAEEIGYLTGEVNGLNGQILYYLADFDQGMECIEKSLVQMSPAFTYGLSGAWYYWAEFCQVLGRHEEAVTRLQQIIRDEPLGSPLTMNLHLGLCFVYREAADFPRLLQSGRAYLKAAQFANVKESIAFAHYHLGVLRYEWNELAQARHHFEAAINLRYHAYEPSYLFSLHGLILVYLAQDKTDKVNSYSTILEQYLQETKSDMMVVYGRSFLARVALQQGYYFQADRESKAAYIPPQIEPMIDLEVPALTRARVLIMRSTKESMQQAKPLLRDLLTHAQKTNIIWRQIEILALQALLLAAQDSLDEALSTLEQAVDLARPGWFVRTFVDLGPPMASLLRQLADLNTSSEYISHILSSFVSGKQQSLTKLVLQNETLTDKKILQPLSNRELEVLTLIEERLTNQEIAQHLNISPKTVKRHASNIFLKLDVHNRRQAAEKGKRLGILPPHLR